MDAGYQLEKENPRGKANCLSKLLFTWMLGLYYKGTQKGLEIKDLYKTPEYEKSEKLGDTLELCWEEEIKNAKSKGKDPRLIMAIAKAFGTNFILWGIVMFFQIVVLRSIQPLILSFLIKLFVSPNEDDPTIQMYISGAVLIGISICTVTISQHQTINLSLCGMRIRVAVCSLIYRKIIRLNQKSLGQTAAGHIVNLLSNDVSRFDFVVIFLHALWILPFQVVLVSYFVWEKVGISSLAGILTMVLFTLPVQGYLGKLTGTLRFRIAKKTDTRVGMMNEIISGIQVIKMYAWEKSFEKMVKLARRNEISDITKTSYIRGFLTSCMVFVERLTLFLTITCFVLLGNVITADTVFALAQFFNILQLAMAIFYPAAISYGAEALVSVRRIQEFLELEERKAPSLNILDDNNIEFSNVSASWTGNNPTLQEINLKVPSGSLCAVIGPVGCGKTSLLQTLLGELPIATGTVSIGKNSSYASQEPWLFASTVRNNILFGQPYDESKYNKVIQVCSLKTDFEQFPSGDRTIVGEKGISLSGGQRARINLARAVYRQADIYLLDDPLSAVDTQVGKELFQECIVRFLKGTTRVLVTHQLQYLRKVDMIAVLNSEGKVETVGTFEELNNNKMGFTEMLTSADEISKTDDEKETDKTEARRVSKVSSLVENGCKKLSNLSVEKEVLNKLKNDIEQTRENEEKTSGDPNISPVWEYYKASGSVCLFVFLVIVFFVAQAVCAGADYWVAFWTEQEQIRHSNSSLEIQDIIIGINNVSFLSSKASALPSKFISADDIVETVKIDNKTYNLLRTDVSIYIYGSLVAASIFLTLTRSLFFFKMAMRASKNLHSKIFHSLLQAPMRFFETNPSGRILNRFSKDMGAVDEILPRVLLDATQIMLVMLGILVNIAASNPYTIAAVIICGVLFYKMRGWYLLTAKKMKYLEGVTKSPVFSHVNSTLNGLTTIRASKVENILMGEFDHHQNVHTSAWYLTLTCSVSFSLWLDLICTVFIACVTFSFIILYSYIEVSGSLVGLAISQSLVLTGMLQHGTRQTAEVVNQMTSVERVLEYTTIESEGKYSTSKENEPGENWPDKGKITFRNVFLSYVDNEPPVLKDLNFSIYSGEKIGIVGRTGAGKSSLIAALFRLVPLKGTIYIDGVDTQQLGLTDLRKKISIIPQEPVLFSATIRHNLDPFNEFDDDKLWKALEDVELKEVIPSLNYLVSESGNNFSVGQRQLICLARAILKNNKILVMDEATANVDRRTDSFIQNTIRRKFKNYTVLTIAHRLNTIMDSDKVMVMHSGSVVEFDHPYKLLQDPEGNFSKMVAETGLTMAEQLKEVALESYNKMKIQEG